MNKLFISCLLSIMILYSQSTSECESHTTLSSTERADKITECKGKEASEGKQCILNSAENACVESPANCENYNIPATIAENQKETFCRGLKVLFPFKECKPNGDKCNEKLLSCGTAIPSTITTDIDKITFCFQLEIPVSDIYDNGCLYKNGKCEEAKLCRGSNSCEGLAVTTLGKGCVKDSESNECVEETICSFGLIGLNLKFCEGLPVSDSKKICVKESGESKQCHEVSKPDEPDETFSGSILNSFKITFVFIIIFAIL